MRAELKQVLAMLLRLWDAVELPANPLDQLTELLGGTSKVCACPSRLEARFETGLWQGTQHIQ